MAEQIFVKRNAGAGELRLYRLLSAIAPACNDAFDVLFLPHAIHIDEPSRTLTMPYFDGERFNGTWDEANGAHRSVSISLSRWRGS